MKIGVRASQEYLKSISKESCGNFGTILERFWNNFGKILEQFWNNFGTILGQI